MSTWAQYFVSCDWCGEDADAMESTPGKTRKAAERQGWRRVLAKDVCPNCLVKAAEESAEKKP